MIPIGAVRLTQSSQRTQIIRHVAELSQYGRIVKIAGSRIASATEPSAGMANGSPSANDDRRARRRPERRTNDEQASAQRSDSES